MQVDGGSAVGIGATGDDRHYGWPRQRCRAWRGFLFGGQAVPPSFARARRNGPGTHSPDSLPVPTQQTRFVPLRPVGEQGQDLRLSADFPWERWCCERGLNSRPLPYQGSALPLSYRSAGSRWAGPPRRGDVCHSAPVGASVRRANRQSQSPSLCMPWTSRRAAAPARPSPAGRGPALPPIAGAQ